jgi:hypothetical protein
MLEIIILQVAEDDRNGVESLMEELAIDVSRESQEVEMSIYLNAALNTDICIQLKSRIGPQASNATHLGLRLAASLKSLGLVDHTCWVEWIANDHSEYSG